MKYLMYKQHVKWSIQVSSCSTLHIYQHFFTNIYLLIPYVAKYVQICVCVSKNKYVCVVLHCMRSRGDWNHSRPWNGKCELELSAKTDWVLGYWPSGKWIQKEDVNVSCYWLHFFKTLSFLDIVQWQRQVCLRYITMTSPSLLSS